MEKNDLLTSTIVGVLMVAVMFVFYAFIAVPVGLAAYPFVASMIGVLIVLATFFIARPAC